MNKQAVKTLKSGDHFISSAAHGTVYVCRSVVSGGGSTVVTYVLPGDPAVFQYTTASLSDVEVL